MSDFILSSKRQEAGRLARAISRLSKTPVEFHGEWGSLAATPSMYHGFQPHETEDHICVVIGGPVLYFTTNSFLGGEDTQAGTRAILEHWQSGRADWSEDVSGPFLILLIDKGNGKVECITDMMMFIPLYQRLGGDGLFWGTHIDALADASGEKSVFDQASLVDFVLHRAVTYPYTAYQNIRQGHPGSVHRLRSSSESPSVEIKVYWQPVEERPYRKLDEAAIDLREGIQEYILRTTSQLEKVAQFISGGEDSRVLSGLLPQSLARDAFIFLDSMNREGRIAEKVTKAYGARFTPGYRSENHYLEILPEASEIVGSGHQYTHAHVLGFDKQYNLSKYQAVFGGLLSDSLLKGLYARKPALSKQLNFLPDIALRGETRTHGLTNSLFPPSILDEITRRRREHYDRLFLLRPRSAHEWFALWPATMNRIVPNLYSNRRMFASHEIFMAKESVKVGAGVPVEWKLNRRLFHRAFKAALAKSRFIFHASGFLPYYPWWMNMPMQAFIQMSRDVYKLAGLSRKNHEPWADWKRLTRSDRWAKEASRYAEVELPTVIASAVESGALTSDALGPLSKLVLLQVCYQTNNDIRMC